MKNIPTKTVPMEALAEVIELQLEKGGRANLRVTGCSMMPLFRHMRDSVILVPVEEKQKPGAIIFYRRENGQYVLHRIIRLDGDGYICCGDNQYEQENVEHHQLIGVADGFVRKGKQYSCSDAGYRLYEAVFVKLFPLRRGYIAVRRRFGRLWHRIRKLGIRNTGGKI